MIYPFYFISGTMVYLFHAFSGTLVCVIVSGTAIHLFHRQWYVDELSLHIISGTVVYLFMPSVERWCVLSSVVRRYISFIVSGTAVHLFHRQWYVDESSLSISSVVRWYISLHAFSGTLVCVIVSGTAVHLFILSVVRWCDFC